jgi:hypothetical protein
LVTLFAGAAFMCAKVTPRHPSVSILFLDFFLPMGDNGKREQQRTKNFRAR